MSDLNPLDQPCHRHPGRRCRVMAIRSESSDKAFLKASGQLAVEPGGHDGARLSVGKQDCQKK